MKCQDKKIDPYKFNTYLKYCNDDPRVISGIFKDKKIRFTQPWALNDPLEFNPIIEFDSGDKAHKYDTYRINGILFFSEHRFIKYNLIEKNINNYGILSLTRIYDSFEMWSHYANGHKGFLIEFKNDFLEYPCMKSKTGIKYDVKPIEYIDNYCINVSQRKDSEIELNVILRLFYQKYSRWKNEKEYRVVRLLTDHSKCIESEKTTSYRDENIYLFDFSLNCIQSITFGAHMSIENKKIILECCKHTDIKFYQAGVIQNEKDYFGNQGRIEFSDDPSSFEILPFLFCVDKHTIPVKYVDLKNINEIPYYRGNESWLEEYYKQCLSNAKGNKGIQN